MSATMAGIDRLRRKAADRVEHIVIDGGSDSDSVNGWRAQADTIVIDAPRTNISEALTIGWQRATADFVVVMCAGDVPLEGVFAAGRLLDVSGLSLGVFPVRTQDGTVSAPRSRRTVIQSSWTHAGLVARRDLLDAVGGYNRRFQFAMDWEWLSRAQTSGVRCEMFPNHDPVTEIEPFALSQRRFFSAAGEFLDVLARDCPGRMQRLAVAGRHLPAYSRALMHR
jgi:glycosyltransferase involved in cell wall biosynthesis